MANKPNIKEYDCPRLICNKGYYELDGIKVKCSLCNQHGMIQLTKKLTNT